VLEGFFQGASMVDFSRGEIFKGHFTHSVAILRIPPIYANNLIGKCQISKCKAGQVPLPPLLTPMVELI